MKNLLISLVCFTFFAAPASAGMVDVGVTPVDYYSFDASNATDDAGGNNNGTVNGCSFIDGVFGKALSVDSTSANNYVEILQNVAKDFTIAFWVHFDENAAGNSTGHYWNSHAIIDGDKSGFDFDWGIGFNDNEGISFGLGTTDTGQRSWTAVGSTDLSDGLWHHVAVTRDVAAQTIAIYLDGSATAEATATGTTTNDVDASTIIHFGAPATGTTPEVLQDLDEIYFYDQVLTTTQIGQLAVPEPATMLLLSLGGLIMRKIKR
jgi:hypothetical protein